jgi:truncated hemoglobin YjbI
MATVYEAAGGSAGLTRLADAWHARVLADDVVAHAFHRGFHPDHTKRLAAYWAEALGGPATYTQEYGDETFVVRLHSGNGVHDEMDRRAVECFDAALVDVGFATREPLRRVLHDYFAWATATTMSRYHRSADDVPDDLTIPHWSWDGPVRATAADGDAASMSGPGTRVEFESVMFVTSDPRSDAAFWAGVLDRTPVVDPLGILLPGSSRQVGLRFAEGPARGAAVNRLHLHLSQAGWNQREAIAVCIEHGGRLRGNGHVPENSYAAMADTVGDDFCVIADENAYLAGCGPLGEVTCDGTKTVGLFWSRALGWPVVWDEGEEIAIQSTAGGTKLAWSGDALDERTATDRQTFCLSVDPAFLDGEVARLIDLGARRRTASDDTVVLRDPDGIDFLLRSTTPR